MIGKYFITTDSWFFAPDGKQYRAAWGSIQIVEDSILGIKTNRNSSNWYIRIGNETNHIIVAGCQIHYAIASETRPNTDSVQDYTNGDSGINIYQRPTNIYIAE